MITVRPGFAELSSLDVHPPSVRLLPRAFCRRAGVFVAGVVDPLGKDPVVLGMAHPDDVAAAELAARMLGRPVEVVRLTRYEVDRAVTLGFDGVAALGVEGAGRVVALPVAEPGPGSSASDLLDHVLADAVAAGASDIHLETYAHDVDVRFRVDGMLRQTFTQVTPANVAEVVSRVKVLAGLDIAERLRAQDGRFRVTFTRGETPRAVDFRVSVVPSPAGEDVVMRILDASRGLLPLGGLGMAPDVLETWRRLVDNPEGLLLVTGPTGSGKTTTLYASLAAAVEDHRKIVTAEDPVEYVLDHVNQKQVTPHLAFADLLRASLRQNPDVLLFGELRDRESVATAAAAAATGHLVLSTLHTHDTVGVVPRLRGMGLEAVDVAEALLGALAQRLVRAVCAGCAEDLAPTAAQRVLFGRLLDGRRFVAGRGCEACRGTGYRGRFGVYELLVADTGFEDLVADGAPTHELRAHARARGQRTLADDALDKAAAGRTTLDEVVRCVPYRQIVAVRDT
ncbi:MAG: GspE/PulE family protein [Myxococcota bacterium]